MDTERIFSLLDTGLTRRVEARGDTNCVIAALESAFHAPATSEERALRDRLSDQKDAALDKFRKQIKTPADAYTVLRANLLFEIRAIQSFFEQLATHNTPLGKAMQRYAFENRTIPGNELPDIIRTSPIVLITLLPRTSRWHMQHAMPLVTGKIVSGNDHMRAITLNDDKSYLSYVFQRKTY